jgi:hypothetical protein
MLKHNNRNGFFRFLLGVATSVCVEDVKYTAKACSESFGGKIPRGHLLFTGIIVADILMFGNFKREDVVSLKMEC